MGVPGVSLRFVIGFILVFVGITLHLIGVATPEWSTDDTNAQGLFQWCTGGNCNDRNYVGSSSDTTDSMRAAAAMNVIGALVGLVAFIMTAVHLGMGCLRRDPTLSVPIVAGFLAIIAFCFILIGVAVWGGAVHDDHLNDPTDVYRIGYSFALSITGGILLLIGGLVLIIGKVQIKVSN